MLDVARPSASQWLASQIGAAGPQSSQRVQRRYDCPPSKVTSWASSVTLLAETPTARAEPGLALPSPESPRSPLPLEDLEPGYVVSLLPRRHRQPQSTGRSRSDRGTEED